MQSFLCVAILQFLYLVSYIYARKYQVPVSCVSRLDVFSILDDGILDTNWRMCSYFNEC